jgi:hypothetical protein
VDSRLRTLNTFWLLMIVLNPFARVTQPDGPAPVATGRAGSATQLDQEPT